MNQQFKNSYLKTIETMDPRIIYPFSEFESQTSYALDWVFLLEQRLNPSLLTSRETLLKNIPSASEIRSMFIMDLISYFMASVHIYPSSPVLQFYLKALDLLYPEDKFSCFYTNRPFGSGREVDFEFYENTLPEVQELFSLCYAHAYAKNYDIFVGNSCETTGPFFKRSYAFLVTEFKDLDLKFITFDFSRSVDKTLLGVDLFGHSLTEDLGKIAVMYQGKYLMSQNLIQQLIKKIRSEVFGFINDDFYRTPSQKLEKMLTTRIERYGCLLGVFDKDKIFDSLNYRRVDVDVQIPRFVKWLDRLNFI